MACTRSYDAQKEKCRPSSFTNKKNKNGMPIYEVVDSSPEL